VGVTDVDRSIADDESPPPPPERPGWAGLALIDRFLIPILTAMLAVGATYIGATLANEGALTTQREQIAEDRPATDRDRRAETYLAFLDVATDYAYSVDGSFECGARENPPGSGTVPLSDECNANLAAVGPARTDFQNARNLVYYYGSQEAQDAAGLLAATLPPAVGKFDPDTFEPVDLDAFGAQYREFNRIVCEDVQTDPARRCD